MNYLIVAAGAALGGVLRYWLSGIVQKLFSGSFPYGTLAVNLAGSFILGIIMFHFSVNEIISRELRVFITIGFCGGLTTFSTFSFETFQLLRDAEYLNAGINVLLNVIVTIVFVALAFIISKKLSGV